LSWAQGSTQSTSPTRKHEGKGISKDIVKQQNIRKINESKRQRDRKTDNVKVVEEQSELCGVENLTLATHLPVIQ
jgi:hypothetical protein